MSTPCSVPGCVRPAKTKGFCGLHYQRNRFGIPFDLPPRMVMKGKTMMERLVARLVVNEAGCWIWTGGTDRHGYGLIGVGRRGEGHAYVHRVSYEFFVGPIPEGLQIDHLCRVPLCCRPEHLEAVTATENKLRGESMAAQNARKTHCKRGHEFNPANTRYVNGGRLCIACKRERDRTAYQTSDRNASRTAQKVCPICLGVFQYLASHLRHNHPLEAA